MDREGRTPGPDPDCKRCGGTGWRAYDKYHAKVCEFCCPHDQGWWELTHQFDGYREGMVTLCCRRGCGETRDG